MISTVTTATISTVTTVIAAASLGLIAVLALIAFLASKEMAATGDGIRQRLLSRALNVAIMPLLMVFGVIVAVKVIEAL